MRHLIIIVTVCTMYMYCTVLAIYVGRPAMRTVAYGQLWFGMRLGLNLYLDSFPAEK